MFQSLLLQQLLTLFKLLLFYDHHICSQHLLILAAAIFVSIPPVPTLVTAPFAILPIFSSETGTSGSSLWPVDSCVGHPYKVRQYLSGGSIDHLVQPQLRLQIRYHCHQTRSLLSIPYRFHLRSGSRRV